ncbi:MAG: DUF934 domain-containing protein [Pseudomonadota bacterium]|nr:oxidoreductase [Pseudomonadales bacterium]MDY6919922.1 DUF934 domain-containing protein [Pseudomonadota bacterium]
MPRKIIKDRAIVDDSFTVVNSVDEFPRSGDVILDIALWQELAPRLQHRPGKVGVKVPVDVEPEDLVDLLGQVDVIAIEFPVFRDGRGYSLARILRERLGYEGELRACGDVLRDQMFYLQRCGFNSFVTREDRCIEDALNGLHDFSVTYQADALEKRPIYLRR